MWFKMHATDVKKDRMEVRSVKTSGVCVSDVIVCLILVIFSVAGFMGGDSHVKKMVPFWFGCVLRKAFKRVELLARQEK